MIFSRCQIRKVQKVQKVRKRDFRTFCTSVTLGIQKNRATGRGALYER